MPQDAITLVLAPIDLSEISSVRQVKLIRSPDASLLLLNSTTSKSPRAIGSETVIRSLALDMLVSTELFRIPQLLPVAPAWDAIMRADGSWWVAYERAGGAVNAIALENNEGFITDVNYQHPFEHFTFPRFSIGDSEDHLPQLTAVADNMMGVAFLKSQGETYSSYIALQECLYALLVQQEQGSGLVYKIGVPGLPRDNIAPGVLHYALLDADWKVRSTPVQVFGDQVIFEFDVGEHRGEMFIVATAIDDLLLASKAEPSNPFQTFKVKGEYNAHQLVTPTILFLSPHLHIAALERTEMNVTRLLYGSIAYEPPLAR